MTERTSEGTVEKVMGLLNAYKDSSHHCAANCDDYPNEASHDCDLTREALERAITELCAERDRWKQHHKELVNDFLPDNECLPACDSYGHADECPVYDAQAASRKLIADCDSLVSQLDAAMRENARLNAIEALRNTCVVCSASLIVNEAAPHCIDCMVTDDQYADWEEEKTRLSSGEVSK